jgi:hypothetical protein
MSYVGSEDYFFNVAKGNITTEVPVSLVAINETVGVTLETIWPFGGRYVFPTTTETLDIVSDNAADTAAGAGLRTVLVSGLDASYLPISETIALNGVTPVTTLNSYFRVNQVVAKSAGANLTASGNITVTNTTSAQTLAYIRQGDNITRQGVFTVPATTSLYFISLETSGGKADEYELNFLAYNFGENIPINVVSAFDYQSVVSVENRVFKKFAEKTDIEFTAIDTGSGASSRVSMFSEFILDVS